MDKKVILSRLLLLCVVSMLMGNSMVHAQNQSFQTDTVIHQEFGCDSYLLPANHTVYYADTVIKIPLLRNQYTRMVHWFVLTILFK